MGSVSGRANSLGLSSFITANSTTMSSTIIKCHIPRPECCPVKALACSTSPQRLIEAGAHHGRTPHATGADGIKTTHRNYFKLAFCQNLTFNCVESCACRLGVGPRGFRNVSLVCGEGAAIYVNAVVKRTSWG